jgi:hypothetical protein
MEFQNNSDCSSGTESLSSESDEKQSEAGSYKTEEVSNSEGSVEEEKSESDSYNNASNIDEKSGSGSKVAYGSITSGLPMESVGTSQVPPIGFSTTPVTSIKNNHASESEINKNRSKNNRKRKRGHSVSREDAGNKFDTTTSNDVRQMENINNVLEGKKPESSGLTNIFGDLNIESGNGTVMERVDNSMGSGVMKSSKRNSQAISSNRFGISGSNVSLEHTKKREKKHTNKTNNREEKFTGREGNKKKRRGSTSDIKNVGKLSLLNEERKYQEEEDKSSLPDTLGLLSHDNTKISKVYNMSNTIETDDNNTRRMNK